ncbi:MAG: HAD family hydrolase [Wenyingzhuangia sp.]|jgi:Cof subfamily protein (haloacid dehalogenase superfamily)|uniref:HAD family hydrolase n=1 Tax=Wenyingzhuangia sp. TaxID=1964193 RepID=UPI00321AA0D7
MDLTKVKMIVTDMDGTLLNPKHQVSDLFFEQFEVLKANQIRFVAASGRQYHSILEKLDKIKKDITIVAENGAYIVENGTEVYANTMTNDEVLKLVHISQQIPKTHIVICGKSKAYFLRDSGGFKEFVAEYFCEYEMVNSFEDLPDDVFFKIALCNYESSEKNIYPYLASIVKDWKVTVSSKQWLDIAIPNNHKGNAVSCLQEKYGISEEETMAFGDYLNDIEMLKKATYSFAMENAHSEVKQVASKITLSNHAFGVETIIGKLIAGI